MTSDKGVVERLRDRVESPFERPAVDQALMSKAAARIIETLEQALSGLVKKLDAIDKPVTDIFVFAGAHGYHYDGPNYTDELNAARSALSPSPNGAEK